MLHVLVSHNLDAFDENGLSNKLMGESIILSLLEKCYHTVSSLLILLLPVVPEFVLLYPKAYFAFTSFIVCVAISIICVLPCSSSMDTSQQQTLLHEEDGSSSMDTKQHQRLLHEEEDQLPDWMSQL